MGQASRYRSLTTASVSLVAAASARALSRSAAGSTPSSADIFKLNRAGALGAEVACVVLGEVRVNLDWEPVHYGGARPLNSLAKRRMLNPQSRRCNI
jgi:hypothetical protein